MDKSYLGHFKINKTITMCNYFSLLGLESAFCSQVAFSEFLS